jgi:hypothetical protein
MPRKRQYGIRVGTDEPRICLSLSDAQELLRQLRKLGEERAEIVSRSVIYTNWVGGYELPDSESGVQIGA